MRTEDDKWKASDGHRAVEDALAHAEMYRESRYVDLRWPEDLLLLAEEVRRLRERLCDCRCHPRVIYTPAPTTCNHCAAKS